MYIFFKYIIDIFFKVMYQLQMAPSIQVWHEYSTLQGATNAAQHTGGDAAKEPAMKKVEVFEGYAIFASFDGLSPDTTNILLVESQELATKVVEALNSLPKEETSHLAYAEGFEYVKEFQCRCAFSAKEADFVKDFEAAKKTLLPY